MSEELFKNAEPTVASEGGTDDVSSEASYLERLVGDGKKFSDTEALAKGKTASDKHVADLEKEMIGLREDLNSRLNMQTFLDRLESTGVTSSSGTPPSESVVAGDEGSTQAANLSMADIEKMVATKLKETTTAATRESNTQGAISTLQQNLGSSYGDKVLEVTKELGVGKEFMMELAATNPQAFLKLVGADKTPAAQANPSTYTAPRSVVNSGAMPTSSGAKTDTYYNNLRKTDPKAYWNKATQVEMHREAMKQGEAFFDKP